MLLNLPPNPLPISMPPPLLSLQKKKEKHGDKRGGSSPSSPKPDYWFCRCTEAKRWANQSLLEHEDRVANMYALCGWEIE